MGMVLVADHGGQLSFHHGAQMRQSLDVEQLLVDQLEFFGRSILGAK